MHIYFSGIGGVGLGPLAEIARDSGHGVSGSDLHASPTFLQLQQAGFRLSLDQSGKHLAHTHQRKPIDWFVYSSSLLPDHPELAYATSHGIPHSKRDELLKKIIADSGQKLIAVAGTHGKTTTTAMIVWLFTQLKLPVSYSIGAPLTWAPSGLFNKASEYFIYECDEFDRNFLRFHPDYSVITSIDYDHADTYPTEAAYQDAFREFLNQSDWKVLWQTDAAHLHYKDTAHVDSLKNSHPLLSKINLVGEVNRRNALLAIQTVWNCTTEDGEALLRHINTFPGVQRRFEKLAPNLYSDYAHHPTEIAGTLELARELSDHVVVVYQPHQNTRQHHLDYSSCFDQAEKIYWLSTYLSREDPSLPILSSHDLTKKLDPKKIVLAELNPTLWQNILNDQRAGALVIMMGAGSIDEWVRHHSR